jgi:membrane dipeptidase
MRTLHRRTFLSFAAAALAAPPRGYAASAAHAPEAYPAGGALPRGALIVNALGGLEDPNRDDSDSDSQPIKIEERVLRDAHASGLTAVNVTLGYVSGPKDPFEFSVRDVAEMDARVRANARDLIKVFTVADIVRAKSEGRIGILYGFQNAAMMGSDASRVDLFANLGVRVIQLTYNPVNQLGDGSMAPENRGLTPFGRELVERLNAHRTVARPRVWRRRASRSNPFPSITRAAVL